MYLDFYGINEKPFNLSPDTRFLYLSKNHQDALNNLIYGIREKEWFMVLTGEIGTGKTTIIRALMEKLNGDTSSALILDPLLEGEELLKTVLEDFGIDNAAGTRKELVDRLNQFLLGELRQGRKTVLVIDEAQHLSDRALEEIRLLSNLETETEKFLQIILVGQVELHQKLESLYLRPLNQRISIRYHLLPLSRLDTEQYIRHRLLVAGSNGQISFTAGALNEIFKQSRGIPRLISLVCDRTLLAGYARQSTCLNKQMVKKGAESLKKQGGHPTLFPRRGRVILLGALALFLWCVFLMAFQRQGLYMRFLKAPQSVGMPISTPMAGEREPSVAEPYSMSVPVVAVAPAAASSYESAPDISHQYCIHVSSYRDNTNALMDINQLHGMGYPDFTITKIDIPGKGTWYRVMSEKFKTKAAALAMREKIRALKGFSNARIIMLNRGN
jgi:general secretion pathway protein A